MFGVLTMHLARLVNHGHSYESASDVYKLLERFPLQHTFVHLMKPQQNTLPFPTPSDKASLSNFHLIKYNRKDRVAVGRYHSQYSVDIPFVTCRKEALKKQGRKKAKKAAKNSK